ncbi:TRAP transporter substrate-binding protein [Shumkonia mesophila]|uniref:TRAP transporter substrate-binding protein n=1 Tax=Shumkonia mesophila TaxID=2838854 RepID=UPI0029350BF7|nr:TRAP transporter substrate-binding protein [Shumkonia mesophila]
MKNFTWKLAAATVAVGLLAANPAAAATKLRLSCPSAMNNPTCMPAEVFAKEAERLTNGSLAIQIFPSGQLGKAKEAIQQMQAGIIDIVVESLENYTAYVKDLNIIGWGFAFRDADHFNTFLGSPAGDAIFAEMDTKHGMVFLARNWRKLPRVVVSTKPIFTPENLTGLKFRVPSIPTYIKTWQTLGANPSQVAWADTFQALKTGVVDAMESPFDSVAAQKFHVAAPYVTMTNHVFTAITLAFNAKKFHGLSQDEQAALRTAADKASEYSVALARDSSGDIAKTVMDDGGYIITLKPSAFQKKLRAATDEQEAAGMWRKGLFAEIQKM